MNTLLIRQYQETKSKYLKLSGRLQRSYDTGEFYRLPGKKQNWLVSRVRKLWERLKMLEKQLKLAIAAGTITLLLTFSDGIQAQPNFILSPDKNPCPPPLIYGMSPIVNDVDMDGDLDILATHEANKIIWYKNVGTASSADFIKVPDDDNPFIVADSLDLETWDITSLVDIDGDGDIDIFTEGYPNSFFKNTGTAENPVFEPAVNPLGVYYYEAALVDIDGDGDLDMVSLNDYSVYEPISMKWIHTARISTIQNIGTPQVPNMNMENPVYLEVANQPEGVNYYRSQVIPMDDGNDDDIDFLVEAEFYNEPADSFYTEHLVIENTGTSQIPQFAFLNDENNPFSGLVTNGYDQEICPADMDDDGDIDALLNESYIGLAYYRNTGNTLVKDESIEDLNGFFLSPSYFTPPFVDFDGDGDLDYYTFSFEEEMPGVYYENTGNVNNPEFTASEDYFPFIQVTGADYFFPLFVDIDSDGDLDCFAWYYQDYGGMVMDYYKNTGTQQSPNYQLDNYNNPIPVLEDMATMPSFADFDGDGDKDMIICTYYDNEYSNDYEAIKYYRNTGDPGVPEFTLMEGTNNPFNGVDEVSELYGSPLVIADLDMDGDFDVFFSDYYGNTGFRENTGTPTTPAFSINDAKNPLRNIKTGYYGGFSLVDLDGDGDKDLFITSLYNTIVSYYINTDPRTSSIGNQKIIQGEFLNIYPNPASDYCILNLDGPSSGMCDLKIINIHGQVLRSESFRKVNGNVQYQLDVSGLSTGVYLVSVTQGNHNYITRLTVE
jgi:hypothetical protein